jgi:hypothetical protein
VYDLFTFFLYCYLDFLTIELSDKQQQLEKIQPSDPSFDEFKIQIETLTHARDALQHEIERKEIELSSVWLECGRLRHELETVKIHRGPKKQRTSIFEFFFTCMLILIVLYLLMEAYANGAPGRWLFGEQFGGFS